MAIKIKDQSTDYISIFANCSKSLASFMILASDHRSSNVHVGFIPDHCSLTHINTQINTQIDDHFRFSVLVGGMIDKITLPLCIFKQQ
jgi:hypothetical protein